jgi:hypothetical protein
LRLQVLSKVKIIFVRVSLRITEDIHSNRTTVLERFSDKRFAAVFPCITKTIKFMYKVTRLQK